MNFKRQLRSLRVELTNLLFFDLGARQSYRYLIWVLSWVLSWVSIWVSTSILILLLLLLWLLLILLMAVRRSVFQFFLHITIGLYR
jgi:hypothetical protein